VAEVKTVSLGIVMSKSVNILCGRKFYVEYMKFEGMIATTSLSLLWSYQQATETGFFFTGIQRRNEGPP
jgi:hypothetical protein